MEIYSNINKAYRAVQGTHEEAFAVVEVSRAKSPIVGGYSLEFYYALVAYNFASGTNYRRLSNKITQIHV
jgi:hypothetical protein